MVPEPAAYAYVNLLLSPSPVWIEAQEGLFLICHPDTSRVSAHEAQASSHLRVYW